MHWPVVQGFQEIERGISTAGEGDQLWLPWTVQGGDSFWWGTIHSMTGHLNLPDPFLMPHLFAHIYMEMVWGRDNLSAFVLLKLTALEFVAIFQEDLDTPQFKQFCN